MSLDIPTMKPESLPVIDGPWQGRMVSCPTMSFYVGHLDLNSDVPRPRYHLAKLPTEGWGWVLEKDSLRHAA